jgi:hypothetical protein
MLNYKYLKCCNGGHIDVYYNGLLVLGYDMKGIIHSSASREFIWETFLRVVEDDLLRVVEDDSLRAELVRLKVLIISTLKSGNPEELNDYLRWK